MAITIPLDMNVDMFRKQDTTDALGINTLSDDVSTGIATIQTNNHILAKSLYGL